jgi:hypothetical protein
MIAAYISSIAIVVVALLGYVGNRKLNEIHVLVNSRLSEALSEIKDLQLHLAVQKTLPAEDDNGPRPTE